MKLIKRGHACLEIIEESGVRPLRLVIDPGNYTESLSEITDVLAVVVTHQHEDHCSNEQLAGILANSPEAKIFGPQEVCDRLAGLPTTAVYHGDHYEVGPFQLDFFGDLHQEIHRSIPLVQNTGIMVNRKLYYPGDSYTTPDLPVELLACPSSAPWLKIGDVMDFLDEIRPRRSFSTHNALLSEHGHKLNNSRIQLITEKHGGTFSYLEPGQSLEF